MSDEIFEILDKLDIEAYLDREILIDSLSSVLYN